MSEETKRKYTDLAKNSAKTRVPGLTVQKLVQQKLAQTAASAGHITLEEPMMDGSSGECLDRSIPANNRRLSDHRPPLDRAIQRRRPPTPYPSTTSIVDEDLEQPVNRKRSDDSDDSTTSLHPPERKRPRVD